MSCKRALLFGSVGGVLIGAVMYAVTTLCFAPDSLMSLSFEAIHYPLSPLYSWLRHSFASTGVDVDLIYFFVFPIYWALLGFSAGLVCWAVFRKRAGHANNAV